MSDCIMTNKWVILIKFFDVWKCTRHLKGALSRKQPENQLLQLHFLPEMIHPRQFCAWRS